MIKTAQDRPRPGSPPLDALLILLLAFALRIHYLALDAIWWDEGYSVWISRLSLPRMVTETARDVHPPLYYAILHGWMRVAGHDEIAIRLLSVFFGLVALTFVYRAAQLVGGRWAASTTGLLVAVAPVTVRWSQEARMHTLAACCASLALWAALHLILSDRRRWPWALMLGLASLAAFLTLYLAAGAILAIDLGVGLAVLLRREGRWRLTLPWLASQVGASVLFLPWYLYASRRLPVEASPLQLSLLPFANVYGHVTLLGLAENLERYTGLFIVALLLAAAMVVASGVAARLRARLAWLLLVIGALLPPLWLYAIFVLPRAENFDNPSPSARYVVALSAPLYILLGWGVATLARRSRAAASVALAGLVGLSAWPLDAYYRSVTPAGDYATAAAVLDALARPDDVVLLNNDREWPTFAYYVPDYQAVTYTQVIHDDDYAAEVLDTLAADSSGVWLVQTPFAADSDPQNRLPRLLAEGSARYVFDLPNSTLTLFARTPDRIGQALTPQHWPEGFRSVLAPLSPGAAFTGYTLSVPAARQGQRIGVGLGWQVDDGSGEWPVALKLVASNGEEILSEPISIYADRPGRYFRSFALVIPANAPRGPAQLILAAGEVWQPLGRMRLLPANRQPAPPLKLPAEAIPFDIEFGDAITLQAVSPPELTHFAPGDSVPLTLYWRADGLVPDAYKVFVHVVGDQINPATGSLIWGQQDQEPGGISTSSWLPGDQVVDSYNIPLDPAILPGRYLVQTGLYQPGSGLRLPAASPDGTSLGDSVVLFTFEIP